MSELLVVRSKLKDYAKNRKNEPMQVSQDFAEALNKEVVALIKKACERAQENKRNTIQSKDL